MLSLSLHKFKILHEGLFLDIFAQTSSRKVQDVNFPSGTEDHSHACMAPPSCLSKTQK